MTEQQMLLSAITALAAVIVYLFFRLQKSYKIAISAREKHSTEMKQVLFEIKETNENRDRHYQNTMDKLNVTLLENSQAIRQQVKTGEKMQDAVSGLGSVITKVDVTLSHLVSTVDSMNKNVIDKAFDTIKHGKS